MKKSLVLLVFIATLLAIPVSAYPLSIKIGGLTVNLAKDFNPANLGDGEHSGDYLRGKLAGEALAQFEVVYLNGDGKVYKASATDATTCPAIGVATTAVNIGEAVTVLQRGYYRHDAGTPFVVGSLYETGYIYLSTTSGAIATSAPQTTGNQVQWLGWSYAPQIRFVNPSSITVEVP